MPKKKQQQASLVFTDNGDDTVSIKLDLKPAVENDTKSSAVAMALQALKLIIEANPQD